MLEKKANIIRKEIQQEETLIDYQWLKQWFVEGRETKETFTGKTKNGCLVLDLRRHNWGMFGDKYLIGNLRGGNASTHNTYGIWNLEGKTEFVHNWLRDDTLGDFDLEKK